MSSHADLMLRIQTLLDESGSAPTPANYDFWYRYATDADVALVEAVDAIRQAAGKLNERAMANIRRDIYGSSNESVVAELLRDAHDQMKEVAELVEQFGEDTQGFRQMLEHDATPAVDATRQLIERIEAMEEELAASSRRIVELRRELESARLGGQMDPLTGIANRKALTSYLETQAERVEAEQSLLSMILCDIDEFRAFNLDHGHHVGDEVLRLIGKNLERFCHGSGMTARFGGEEFAVVMPDRGIDFASDIAERFREFIASRRITVKDSNRPVGALTVSMGVAQLGPDEAVRAFIRRAEELLDKAKNDGRNCVCVEDEPAEGNARAA
jgi:diguanylate cyclase